jgi:CHAD domain-containing protein
MDDDFKDREPADVLRPDMDTESAFRLLLSQCCAGVDFQIAQFLERDDPAGAHKARVALRRLTTTLDAFAGILKRKAHAAERAKAKAIFREIGKVREADVYLELRGADAPAKARDKARVLRDAVRRKLRKDRVVGFTPALLGKAADGTLFRAKARGLAARARPLHETAAAALEASRAECLSFAESLSDMSELRRHDLRKALKGLRYAGEFFAPVWDAPDWPRLRVALRDLQDALGDANDLALARDRDGVTDRQAEAEALTRAQKAWSALRATPRWWMESGPSA